MPELYEKQQAAAWKNPNAKQTRLYNKLLKFSHGVGQAESLESDGAQKI
jgi:hypothetical protein